ncbi:MAG: tRNA pseudouridine(38-40) synthase TruA [Haloarculaceae archaeon]
MRAFRVAYDGTGYRGFQRQPDVPTVEDALLDALETLDALEDGTPPGYAAAGRTDAGVSALAQTVAFAAPDWLTPAALNGELPADVRAWASADVPETFHATRDARAREYTYHLHAPDADDDRARGAVDALAGEHDFRDLTPDDRGTVRDLSLAVERDGEFLVLRARAGGFPRALVRRLVGLVEEIATGESPVGKVDRVLGPDPLPGHEGVGATPPEPLVLRAVDYDVEFAVDGDAAASARAVFARKRADRLAGARVAGAVSDGLR